MSNLNFCLILTATIDPKGMPFLARNSIQDRLNDYKNAFENWCKHDSINKIIFIENSGYDLTFFNDLSKKFKDKEIEIISSDVNNNFPRKLGKGYGESLCMQEIFDRSALVNKTKFFISVTGRHYIKNINTVINEIKSKKKDIHICLKDNLNYADTNFYAGSYFFFKNYILPETKKTNDSIGKFYEHCVADAALKAIADGMTFSQLSTYADIDGYIGTNNKKLRYNIFKKIKLFFFGKIKSYFFEHKKY